LHSIQNHFNRGIKGLPAQIIEGVIDGDMVINHPGDDVEDGRSVKIQIID